MITYEEFSKVDIRAGVVIKAELFPRARNPAYKVWVDFGDEIGVKATSAQITQKYTLEGLIGMHVIGVVNIGSRNIAGFVSEFLLLGLPDAAQNIHLVSCASDLKGARLC